MYSVGQTFIYELYNQEFVIKKVDKELDLYTCENTNPLKDEHGMPIMLIVFVKSDYIASHIDVK